MKVQLTQEVADLKTASEVSNALDEKLAWLHEFNLNIIDYDKICAELEGIVTKDRTDLDALIKPPSPLKGPTTDIDIAEEPNVKSRCITNWSHVWQAVYSVITLALLCTLYRY